MWGRVADTWGWEDQRVHGVGEELASLGCFFTGLRAEGLVRFPGWHFGGRRVVSLGPVRPPHSRGGGGAKAGGVR